MLVDPQSQSMSVLKELAFVSQYILSLLKLRLDLKNVMMPPMDIGWLNVFDLHSPRLVSLLLKSLGLVNLFLLLQTKELLD